MYIKLFVRVCLENKSVSVSVGFCTKAAWRPHFQAGRVTCCDIVQVIKIKGASRMGGAVCNENK